MYIPDVGQLNGSSHGSTIFINYATVHHGVFCVAENILQRVKEGGDGVVVFEIHGDAA